MKLLILLFLLVLIKICLKEYFYKENFEACSYEDYKKTLKDNLKGYNSINDGTINSSNKYYFDTNSTKLRNHNYFINQAKNNLKKYNKNCNNSFDNKKNTNIKSFKDNLEEIYDVEE